MILMCIPRFLEANNILSLFSYHMTKEDWKCLSFGLNGFQYFKFDNQNSFCSFGLVLSRGLWGAMVLLTIIFIASLWWKWPTAIPRFRYCWSSWGIVPPFQWSDKVLGYLLRSCDSTQLWKRKRFTDPTDAKPSSYQYMVSMTKS